MHFIHWPADIAFFLKRVTGDTAEWRMEREKRRRKCYTREVNQVQVNTTNALTLVSRGREREKERSQSVVPGSRYRD